MLTTDTGMNIDPGAEVLIDYGPVFFTEQNNAQAT